MTFRNQQVAEDRAGSVVSRKVLKEVHRELDSPEYSNSHQTHSWGQGTNSDDNET